MQAPFTFRNQRAAAVRGAFLFKSRRNSERLTLFLVAGKISVAEIFCFNCLIVRDNCYQKSCLKYPENKITNLLV